MPRGDIKGIIAHQWAPGQSGNPGGRPAYKSGIRKVTPAWADALAHHIFHEPESVFLEFLKEESRTVGEKITAKLVERVYITGDPQAFKILIEALIGKPKEQVVVSRGPDVDDTPTIDTISDEELERRRSIIEGV